MKHRLTSRLILPLALAVGVACTPLAHALPEFDIWVENVAQDWVRADPMTATRTQYLPAAAQAEIDRKLDGPDGLYLVDSSARIARAAAAQRGLAELQKWPETELTNTQRTSREILDWRFREAIRLAEADGSLYVFHQFRGLQIVLVNFLTQTHPIRNARDVDNYLARLTQVAPLLDRGIAEARARAARGIVPPDFILKSTLGGLDRLLAPEPAKNVLVTTLAESLTKLKDLPEADRAAVLARAESVTAGEILPALGRVRALLAEQAKTATADAGLWKIPGGDKVYAAQLATMTTTDLSPDEIHAIGLREVARIEGEMDVIFRQLGYAEGTVNERYDALEAKLQPPAEPDPRPALIAQYTRIVRDAELRAPAFFDLLPKAPVEVRREPVFTESTAAARYSLPAPDGSKPGIFWTPLPGPSFRILGMRTLAYHEAIPGHHYQLALQQELDLPRFRKLRAMGGIVAFSEGWGLYAEQLADEAGWYEGDAQGRLGYLNAQLFRARRLVVDTGLHAKKWTRQQAIDYGIPATEVERYVVFPGQACAYMIGRLKLVECRERAKAALGAKFSLREFHNLVLRTGELPLAVLDRVVDEWIATQKAGT